MGTLSEQQRVEAAHLVDASMIWAAQSEGSAYWSMFQYDVRLGRAPTARPQARTAEQVLKESSYPPHQYNRIRDGRVEEATKLVAILSQDSTYSGVVALLRAKLGKAKVRGTGKRRLLLCDSRQRRP